MADIIRLKRDEYLHVLDNNKNVTRLIVGPSTFTRLDQEQVVLGPEKMVVVPPRFYCCVKNPHVRDEKGEPVADEHGQIKLRLGDEEILTNEDRPEPFPLYPGEVLHTDGKGGAIKKLTVIPKNTALKLRADRDFVDKDKARKAGDEWLFHGPGTYIPNEKVSFIAKIEAHVVRPNEALKIAALVDFTDREGKKRRAGEEWLVRKEGAFMPEVEEKVIGPVRAEILTEKKAIEIEALDTHEDQFKKKRRAGERWLVTLKEAASYIPEVNERVTRTLELTTLNNRQYCTIENPIDKKTGLPRFGHREVRRGEGDGTSFFLQPGEELVNGRVEDVLVLGPDEALLLQAYEAFEDKSEGKAVKRSPGEKWMIRGPLEYIPPVEVGILEKRKTIPLDETEGIYVRDLDTGKVRIVTGKSYMLESNEELWEKELPPIVEELLQTPHGAKHMVKDAAKGVAKGPRDRTRAVRFNISHGSVVQIYDYAAKKPRIVFGPDLVMLQPDESFTVLSLSGDKPKRPHVIKALHLQMGPEFMTDHIHVETSDHARLELRLSYNWEFRVNRESEEECRKLFSVPDFVGDACKALAGRIRGQVAMESFDSFHRNSARIIRAAVFGIDENRKVRNEFRFAANNLVVTNVDIQSVEPVDQKTRDSLQKSVQLAIEITTKSQEATARHKAEREAQKANAELERRQLQDSAEAERQKKEYLKLQAESEAIEATGQAKAEAKARAEALLIEADSELEQARLKAEALKISSESELELMKSKHQAMLDYQKKLNDLEVKKADRLSQIEAKKFEETMSAIGPETVLSIAQAGPELQAKLLEGLGLKGYLITDGNSPINLFNTAGGMIGGMAK